MSGSSNYPLGYTENEALRLAHQAAYLEDLTEDAFRRAGIGSGMHVLDLGCGVGDVSMLAARMVGTDGKVLGIDRNALSVATARQRAAAAGVRNVRFDTAELGSFDTTETYHALLGRFVLAFMPDPAATLRRFQNFLKPRGIIAFQEGDMEETSAVPASELLTRVRSWCVAGFKAVGADPNMGRKLLKAFLAASLPRPTMIAAQRVESGPDSYTYIHIAEFARSMLPLLERAGIATAAEVAIETLADRLRQEAIASESVTFGPRLVGAWSRLPG
jgi:ubiquinone/menaquinone biosynthesis C-methylase UbiE